jgi:hypothetical protein
MVMVELFSVIISGLALAAPTMDIRFMKLRLDSSCRNRILKIQEYLSSAVTWSAVVV